MTTGLTLEVYLCGFPATKTFAGLTVVLNKRQCWGQLQESGNLVKIEILWRCLKILKFLRLDVYSFVEREKALE